MRQVERAGGLTFASSMAVLYAIFVFIPAIIYLELMVGVTGIPVAWFTVVLWVELGKIVGYRVSKQEATMVFILATAELFIPSWLIYRAYFRTSDIARLFGISNEIPTWFVPDPSSGVLAARTFLTPEWALPLAISIVEMSLDALCYWALAIFGRRLFIEVEDLPFPMEQVTAGAILTITEEKTDRIRLLFFTSIISFFYGFVLYALPFIGKAWTGRTMSIIPLPWYDLSSAVEQYFPGAGFGVATNVGPIAAAFVLPVSVTFGVFVGSFAIYFFGNWLSVTYDFSLQPWFARGIPLSMALQRSTLYMWGVPLIGLGLAAGIAPILRHPLVLRRLFTKPSAKKGGTLLETFSLVKWSVIPFAVVVVASTIFYAILTPSFPLLYITPFIAFLPIVLALIDGRMLGTTGLTYGSNNLNILRIAYKTSGYKGVDVWFVPWPWLPVVGPPLSELKVCQLTETSARTLIKAWWIFFPLSVLAGIIYVQAFWSIGSIPSARYPGASIYWPIRATYDSLWIRGSELGLFRADWLLGSFAFGVALHFLFDFLKLPISFISIAAGTVTYPPVAMTYIIGLIVRFTICKYVGKEWFEDRKQILSAGLLMGEAMAVTISIAITLVVDSIWILPY